PFRTRRRVMPRPGRHRANDVAEQLPGPPVHLDDVHRSILPPLVLPPLVTGAPPGHPRSRTSKPRTALPHPRRRAVAACRLHSGAVAGRIRDEDISLVRERSPIADV